VDLPSAKRLLGIEYKVTESELKTIYRQLAIKLHPDTNKNTKAAEDFRNLNAAYQLLLKNLNTLKTQPKPQPTCPKIFRTVEANRTLKIPKGALEEDDLCMYIMSGNREFRVIFKKGLILPTTVKIEGLGEFKLVEEIPHW
jgi:preprotein translocase subunit Sec63